MQLENYTMALFLLSVSKSYDFLIVVQDNTLPAPFLVKYLG